METRQGKIEEKHLRFATNKAAYATFRIDGKNYNVWVKDIIDAHNPDDFVEFTGEQEGKFWTLKTMKKIDELTQTQQEAKEYFDKGMAKNGAKEYHLSPEEVKCRALECAIAMCRAWDWRPEGDMGEALIKIADQFVEWIRNGN